LVTVVLGPVASSLLLQALSSVGPPTATRPPSPAARKKVRRSIALMSSSDVESGVWSDPGTRSVSVTAQASRPDATTRISPQGAKRRTPAGVVGTAAVTTQKDALAGVAPV
jgi:hypothetical protein